MQPHITLRRALEDPQLLAGALPGESFRNWRVILTAAMGEPLDDAERALFRRFTERDPPVPK